VLPEPIRPPLINSTISQYKQYFAYRTRSLRAPCCDKTAQHGCQSTAPVSVASGVFRALMTGVASGFSNVARRGVRTFSAGADPRGLLCRPVTRDTDAP
jgi:hypothetical protein